MRKGQIFLGIAALILVLALYFGGNTIKNKAKNNTQPVESPKISFNEYETQKVVLLNDTAKKHYEAILSELKQTNADDTASKKKKLLELSKFWKNIGNDALGTYYFYQFAQIENTGDGYESAADAMVDAYKNTQDSIILNNLITFALQSYELAVQKNGSNIDLKIKLADAYVQGGVDPMKGIGILRKLEDSLPDNVTVLLALGRLSIQSGQYDKAKSRLQKILQLQPQNTEAVYFLAIAEAELGHNEEAIRLFEMCKLLVGNKDFNKEIDEIVKNLKNKKN